MAAEAAVKRNAARSSAVTSAVSCAVSGATAESFAAPLPPFGVGSPPSPPVGRGRDVYGLYLACVLIGMFVKSMTCKLHVHYFLNTLIYYTY